MTEILANGTGIVNSEADYSDVGFIMPPFSMPNIELQGWGYLGGTLEKSLRNLARGMPNLNVIGTPVVHDNYISLTGTEAYLQTSIFQSHTNTLFCIARSSDLFDPEAHQPMLISTFNGQNTDAPAFATQGLSVYIGKSGYPSPVGKLIGGVGTYNPAAPAAASFLTASIEGNQSGFSLISLTVTENSLSIKDWTHGVVVTNPFVAGRVVAPSNRAFAIGGPSNPISYKGMVDIAAWVVFKGALTDSQASMVVARLRNRYAPLGIVT
ncbi:TPA: hypothetical protein ACSTJZ_001339 [Serratia fonticola]